MSFASRVFACFDEILSAKSNSPIAIVSHEGVIKLLFGLLSKPGHIPCPELAIVASSFSTSRISFHWMKSIESMTAGLFVDVSYTGGITTMEDTRSKVQKYMQDEENSLREWYREYHSLELFPGEPCAKLPTLDEIKETFSNWLENRRTQLYNLVCVEWDYKTKRRAEKFQDRVTLVASLADFLIACTLKIPAPVATSVLLAKMGLDEFCIC